MILFPATPITATRLRIARASTRLLSVAPYCLFFLLGTAHSRDKTFRTRLNAAELIGLLNSRSSLRRFSRDRVQEMSRAVWTMKPRHQLRRDDRCQAILKSVTRTSKNRLNARIRREIFPEGAPGGLYSVKRDYFRPQG